MFFGGSYFNLSLLEAAVSCHRLISRLLVRASRDYRQLRSMPLGSVAGLRR
jgi:hypothetical protein